MTTESTRDPDSARPPQSAQSPPAPPSLDGTAVSGGSPLEAEAAETEARWRRGMLAAQQGDAVAYEKLLEELVPLIRRLVRARLSDSAAIDDVVQNSLLSIHRARHTYRPERPFGPWMRTIVRNASIDSLRDRKRRNDREAGAEIIEWLPDPSSGGPPSSSELSPRLRRALDALPEKQREAVELIQVHGLSVAEAALRAGVSPGALKVRAHRGYQALRGELKAWKDEL